MTKENKLKILACEISTDLKDLSDDIEAEMRSEDILASLERVNAKIEDWAKEADRIMEENRIADSQPEVQAERSAEEHN